MKARLEWAPFRDRVDIWLYQDAAVERGRVRRVLQADGGWEEIPIAEGAHAGEPVKPTLELPTDALEAIIAAAGDVLPPSAATDRHLRDAVEIRDRLLALVERTHPGVA